MKFFSMSFSFIVILKGVKTPPEEGAC